jgi:signal peptidase II
MALGENGNWAIKHLKQMGGFIKHHWRDYGFLFLVSGTLLALDQWTKALVRRDIPLGSDWLPAGMEWLLPYARIRHWYNTGAAFGFFKDGNLLFTAVAIIVLIAIFYYFPRIARDDFWMRIAMALQTTGAAGNLVDRLQYKHVTDFISVGDFAIFNIADASITVGVGVLLLDIWIKERALKKQQQESLKAHTQVMIDQSNTPGEDK